MASSDDTVMLQEEMQDDLQQSTGAMAMLAEAERFSAESRHRSLRTIEARMHAAAGEDGILVVSSLSAERNPCEGVGYLSDTFVHLNHKEATFVCIPCSSACKGLCFGPGVEGCAELAEPSTKSRRPPATLLLEEGNRPFSHSFHEAFLQHSAVTTGINVSDVLTDEVLACIADGTCSVSTLGLTESDGPLQYNGTTAVITVMNAEGADTVDISQFPAGLQRAWDAAVKRVGLIPYLREDIDSDDEPQEVPVADEEKDDGVLHSDPVVVAATSLLQEDDGEYVETHQQATCGNWSNRSLLDSLPTFNRVLQGKFKDTVNIEAAKAAKAYAKEFIHAWVGQEDGPCIDAMDSMIGVMQRLSHCYEQLTAVKNPICEAKTHYVNVRDSLNTVHTTSGSIKALADKFANFPKVGDFAKSVSSIFKSIQDRTKDPLKKVKDFKKSEYGDKFEVMDCCIPWFLLSKEDLDKCNVHPGKSHRCGGCDSGLMCNVYKTCNAFTKTELMIDDYGQIVMLPLIASIALFLQDHGTFASCGFSTCDQIKRLTDHIQQQFEISFLNQCPLELINFNFPKPDFLVAVGKVMESLQDFLNKVERIMNKEHCIEYDWPKSERRETCSQVCVKTPRNGRRRRWSGIKWKKSCARTCVPYLHFWVERKRHCFSAKKVLDGISGALQAAFGPILKVIQAAIDAILKPVQNILDGIVDEITKPLEKMKLDLPWPTIGDMIPEIPGILDLQCSDMLSLAR